MKSPNFDAQILLGLTTPGTADLEFAIPHALVRVPLEAFVLSKGGATGAVIYRGPTAWTSTTVYLRSDTVTAPFSLLLV